MSNLHSRAARQAHTPHSGRWGSRHPATHAASEGARLADRRHLCSFSEYIGRLGLSRWDAPRWRHGAAAGGFQLGSPAPLSNAGAPCAGGHQVPGGERRWHSVRKLAGCLVVLETGRECGGRAVNRQRVAGDDRAQHCRRAQACLDR